MRIFGRLIDGTPKGPDIELPSASPLARMALILGLLSAVGPFAIDMYLPAMPGIAKSLSADEASAQLTLAPSFAALGVARIFCGRWPNRVGRKIPLYTGPGHFAAASIGCAPVPSIGWLIAFRILRGLGGAVLMVLPRAVIRENHNAFDATRPMAMVMLVISISTMLVPQAASTLCAPGDWRRIFWVLALAAGMGGALTSLMTGLFFNGTALPIIAAIALCAALTLTITLQTLRQIERARPPTQMTSR